MNFPLTAEMLLPLDTRCQTVQFSRAMTDSDYQTLADWLTDYPTVRLRAYGSYDGSIIDLEFRRFLPTLRRFSADALFHSLVNVDGLGYLPLDIRFLGLGRTKKRLSLSSLARFGSLRRLFIEGQTKHIEVISSLTSLTSLTLRSITLPDLSILLPLKHLRALDLKLGRTKNLGLLPEIGALEYLELWMVKALDDLTPVGEVETLEFLFLQSLRQVTTLPEMARLVRLERVWLETMKGIRDLTPLLTAPVLRQLVLYDMPQLDPSHVAVLTSHPSLASVRTALGSKRKAEQIARMFPPDAPADWTRPSALTDSD